MNSMEADLLADLARRAARLGLAPPGATAPVPEDS
jgi:hypothetical protein